MHVGLNLVFMVPGETGGMEVAARQLIAALPAVAPGLRFTAFVNQEAAAEDLGIERVVVPVAARNRVQWVLGEQMLLPRLAERHGCNLLHSLGSTAPARGRVRRVTTIHDLNYLIVPDAHFGLRGSGMRVLVPLAAHRSHLVLVDSASTRRDVVTRLRVPSGKVEVVPLGLGQPVVADPAPEPELRIRFDLGSRRVVLCLSAKRPHKNLARLLDAVALIPRERRPVVVLPGYPTPHEHLLRERAMTLGIAGDVRFLGWTAERDIEGLFALATCFAYPSLYEGFGLPVLEAMARGVPVACSNCSSLPEVAGDAALLFDPGDVDAIRTAIDQLLGDVALRDRLAADGRRQAARFTWEATAQQTVRAYRRTLAGG